MKIKNAADVAGLARRNKKAVMAAVLIMIMAFMWLRVLFGQGPKETDAASMRLSRVEEKAKSENALQVSFTKLPVTEGRNDVLTRDIFVKDPDVWGAGRVENIEQHGSYERTAEAVRNLLKLEAIEAGPQMRAYINGQVFKAGNDLEVKDENRSYQCEILSISDNTVVVRCEEFEIDLKLIEKDERNN